MKKQTGHQESLKQLQKTDNNFCVVGVGASAGGLEAYNRFVKTISVDSGMAYVLVQHLDADHESQLAEILQMVTKIPVREIKDNMKVEPNTIYVIPSNKVLMANDGVLKLTPRQPKEQHSRFLPIDVFLDSLSVVYSSYSVGVILSGSASDGTQGLKAIKDQGGITFAQDLDSAAHTGMPKSAIDAGVVDFVLTPEEMPKKILEVTSTMDNKIGKSDLGYEENHEEEIEVKKKESLAIEESNVLNKIFSLLRNRKGTDFTYYKKTTVSRRILRRMAINEKKNIVDYHLYLKENPKEQDVLYQDLLIPVTNFFRDIDIIENLCNTVFPIILENLGRNQPIRIWTAGCSTGEEAYTIAICLLEYLDNPSRELPYGGVPKVQIFGTDISEPAIAKARAGIYKKNEVEGLSSKRLENFFTKIDGSYQIDKKVRELCVFALHNFLKDPPFGKMDFISCRNVLIYMEPYLQKKALSTFHYALNPKAHLLLGKSEAVSSVPDLFTVEDNKDKLFSRKDKAGKFMPVTSRRNEESLKDKNEEQKTEPKLTDFQKTADDIILNKYTPSGVVINEAMDIVHFRGNTGKYLEQASGKPTHNVLKMAKMGLAFELRNIIHKARKISLPPKNGNPIYEELNKQDKNSVIKKDIPLEVMGHQRYVDIEAVPLPNLVEPHYLILFHDREIGTSENKSQVLPKNDKKDLRIKQLEQELSQAREDMRSITEDQEAANEELQSANEELQSSSEELQSLNEELETSKEELESTNEELVSVNHEQVSLNKRLTVSRNFAEDVLATIQEPLLVLDKNFMVKSANKSFYKKFRVKEGETEDKSVFELGNHQWEIPRLRELLETILPKKSSFEGFEISHDFPRLGHRTMVVNAREIKREEGGEKLLLLVFGDITDKRLVEKNLEKSEIKFRVMVETIPQLIWITNPRGIAEFFNPQWEHYTGATSKESVKNETWMSFIHPEDVTVFQKKWSKSLKSGKPFSIQYRLKGTDGKYCWFLAKSLPFYNSDGEIIKWFGSFTSIETQKQAEATLQKSKEHFRQLTDLMPDKVSHADATGNVYYYNQSWLNFTGLSLEKLIEEGWAQFIHPDEKIEVLEKWKECVERGGDFEMEMRVKNKNKVYKWHITRSIPVRDEEGKIKLWIGATTEIQKIKEEEKRKEEFLKMVSHELKTPVTSIKGYVQLLLSILKENNKVKLNSIPLESSLERIDIQISKLTRLIAEMLDISRIEEGKLDLQKTTFSLNELVDETIQDINFTNTKHLINIQHDFECKITADKDRIGQVLINFITNAIKYSPDHNKIDVSVKQAGDNQVKVVIKDRGIGISQNDQKDIFKRFYRVSGKNEETYSGLGIGLFLSHEIIKRHHGKINVKSELGKGSSFSFILPKGDEN